MTELEKMAKIMREKGLISSVNNLQFIKNINGNAAVFLATFQNVQAAQDFKGVHAGGFGFMSVPNQVGFGIDNAKAMKIFSDINFGSISKEYQQRFGNMASVETKTGHHNGQSSVSSLSSQFSGIILNSPQKPSHLNNQNSSNILFPEQISNHLNSPPPPRLVGWKFRGSTKEESRKWGNTSWVQESYPDQNEKTLIASVKENVSLRPTMATIKNIMAAPIPTQDKQEEKKGAGADFNGPTFSVLMGSDALQNHNAPVCNGSVILMASQGNCLESTSREVSSLAAYAYDRTQGPASAMSAVDAAIARLAHKDSCDMMQAWLQKYDSLQSSFDYENGYLTPKAGKVKACLYLLNQHGDQILMNIQQVRIDNAGAEDKQWLTQIPCFALALGEYDSFKKSRTQEDKIYISTLCEKLLTLQYGAAAQVAVLKSLATNKRVPLILTPVGGGVFGNDWGAIAKAIDRIKPIIEGQNIDVILSAYGQMEVKHYKENINLLRDAKIITHDQFMSTGLSHEKKHETKFSGFKS